MLCSLLALAGAALANLSASELAQGLEELRPALDEHADARIRLSPEELAAVATPGGIARRWEKLDGADRVIGMTWTDVPRDQLWVAMQDDDNWEGVVTGLRTEILPDSSLQVRWLYEHVDLPWPVADRQWLIRVANNGPLMARSGDRVWERSWEPSPRRDAMTIDDDAVWVEVNDGGWQLIQVGGGTLILYHVRSVIGGNIPDNVATRYAYSTLDNMLEELVERAHAEPEHYRGDHPPIRRPTGGEIPRFP